MAEAVKLYQELGFPALQKGGHDKNLVGYFHADTGTINQLVHLWKFDDDAGRRAHWAAVYENKDLSRVRLEVPTIADDSGGQAAPGRADRLYLFWDMDHPTAAAHAGIAAAATVALIPEPGTMGVLATGLAGIAFMRRRRQTTEKRLPCAPEPVSEGYQIYESVTHTTALPRLIFARYKLRSMVTMATPAEA
jgi:hypothetical protein